MKIIFKKNFSPDSVEFDIKATDTGKDLRAIIAQHENTDPQDVQLKYWGDVIPDDVKVSEYKMNEGDSILYSVKKSLKKTKTEGGSDAKEAVSAPITLTLKREGAEDSQIQVVPEDSIAVVRTKIDQKFNIPDQAIRLKYNNIMMFPAKRLADYYINKDVTLEMIVDDKIAQAEIAKRESAPKEDETMQGEVKLKVKFHDGEEKEVNVDIDETMEELRKKLLNLKPLSPEKKDYRLQVIVGGEEAKDQAKLKDLGIKVGSGSIATRLERVQRDDEYKVNFKRATGPEIESLIIQKDSKIADVKKSLEEVFKAKASEINLQLEGTHLDDEKTVTESGLKEGSLVTVAVIKKSMFSNK